MWLKQLTLSSEWGVPAFSSLAECGEICGILRTTMSDFSPSFSFFQMIYLFISERRRARVRGGEEEEGQADSPSSTESDVGLNAARTLR